MRRPSIKSSLLIILGGLALLFGLIAYLSIDGLSKTNGSTEEIAKNWLPSVQASRAINLNMANLRLAYRDHIIAQSDADKKTREEAIIIAEDTLRKSIDAYLSLASSDRERQLVAGIKESVEGYIASRPQLVVLSRANKIEEAGKYLGGEMRTYSDKLKELTTALVEFNVSGSNKAAEASKTTYASIKFYLIAAIGIAGLLVVGAVAFVLTCIANPIGQITVAMRRLAEGDTGSNIPFAGRADEIGSMAAAVEVFRQAAIANKRMQIEADENRKQADDDRIAAQQKAESDATERLRIATSGLASGLRRLAAGDLAFRLDEPFAPDFEALRHDFNQSIAQLAEVLTAISSSIITIEDGTREISSGADDLSKRTEQQAAALEETAAALEEITANVSNSSKRTEETRTVATQANQSAAKSAEVVSHAEEAMGRIETSSQQISNIIGVIDEIAFQTNLLALNAGVEAARAGEAGKGFAVVAQEVRELAQRSASAAKEIKGLIQNSSKEVESGVKLVRDTGQSLTTIGSFITQINQHMDAIATSAKEQSVGLSEVNVAVNRMDQTTQQNAAMVEQSTAASTSLAQEAQKLRELVSQFKLDDVASGQSTMLRMTARTMAQGVAHSTVQLARAHR
ncbi:methyl-accepting chemotaxis protein [Rhizobium ruizarguesonis]|jgi:methyl-accepting chemotaxis protein|uniref:Methyl-accepting chemotaxis protein n=1 Tax=Rhizobium ruizarguesonis TaxID=2081791 RepID=A0AAE8Q6F9_9HYPH|nr:HAMP domain-containing methyl-accepting chemotaxis protein [Rhizobium ruizarguesonis]QIO49359.1 HAMP domain-containing protein [Rhizobium leguminosarum bv. trifolii]QJS32453.1 HAMP domain-containing protein [Rhizobium leguminosarum bv. trifolii TA1]TAT70268.1 methyl-accepting chemotaxis protein [Rhizobium ruizarguesonis]TAT71276.1 methyl-accepting chemotaxis protein [Rhizobium ruizarguesonis]TAT73016.1 methyl-accepting chemotaxis protein [Rhizobium ruizarguesonis]